jgi:hypothetical protein
MIAPGLYVGWLAVRRIQLPDQLCEAVGHPLAHDIIVHRTQLMPDPGLNFGVKAARFSGDGALRLNFFHDPFHLPQELCPWNFCFIFLILEPLQHLSVC